MARLKLCDVCNNPNLPRELFCVTDGCGASLAFVPETDTESRLVPVQGSDAAVARGTHREVPAFAPRLVFSWGDVTVQDRLPIGRNADFSCLADRLEAFDTVSRRHAEVYVDAGTLLVRHLSTTNPTYVDGRALAIHEVVQLADGSEVAFSRAVTATVRLA